jgi:homoserine dehydrogenase
VALDPLIPDLEQGLEAALDRHSEPLARRLADAAAQGQTLRYTAEISTERVRVGLAAVPLDGPIGALRGPDNILVFRTRRYADYPLVVQGPGAGAEVTAAGVLGDVLKVARR